MSNVSKGADLLDQFFSVQENRLRAGFARGEEWWTRINFDKLDNDNQYQCVLGQIFGESQFGMRSLGKFLEDRGQLRDCLDFKGRPYGFGDSKEAWRRFVSMR